MNKGLYLAFEGGDGTGKTTQILLLEEYLKEKKHNIVKVREPGGTPISEQIRGVLLDTRNTDMCGTTEMLLYMAARLQFIEEIVKPRINEGSTVISDRSFISGVAYQGAGRGLGMDNVYNYHRAIKGFIPPDRVILLDIDPEIAQERKRKLGGLDRLEQEVLGFHMRVLEGYREIAKKHSEFISVVDANRSIEEIHLDIRNIVDEAMEMKQYEYDV